MKPVATLSDEELQQIYSELTLQYQNIKAKNLHLNMARGKPAPEQLDLSMELLKLPKSYYLEDGTDARNYGILSGIPECRRLFAELLDLDAEQIIIGGSSSLNLMFDTMCSLHLFGTGGETPWNFYRYSKNPIKFLCPSPGYDRHFKICEELGMKMIPIRLCPDGPDMEMVMNLVKKDSSIKGIWCVPLHSNPQGVCYSVQTVEQLASMETAAKDFRIFWDNAYGIHHIYEDVFLRNIFDSCAKHGHPDRAYYFFSTSKITFPGAGISLISSSPANINELKAHMSAQTISHDKLNQLRHVQFFKNTDNIHRHMDKLAGFLRPKFDLVLNALDRELSHSGFASWSRPKGGYFISLDTMPGCAKRTVSLAKLAGVTLTDAGATFPYGNDPTDANIRIAPSYPSIEDLRTATDVLILCIKLAGIEKQLQLNKITKGDKNHGN